MACSTKASVRQHVYSFWLIENDGSIVQATEAADLAPEDVPDSNVWRERMTGEVAAGNARLCAGVCGPWAGAEVEGLSGAACAAGATPSWAGRCHAWTSLDGVPAQRRLWCLSRARDVMG